MSAHEEMYLGFRLYNMNHGTQWSSFAEFTRRTACLCKYSLMTVRGS